MELVEQTEAEVMAVEAVEEKVEEEMAMVVAMVVAVVVMAVGWVVVETVRMPELPKIV